MKRPLQKTDIVGLSVKKVYRSQWEYYEGSKICKGFVELANESIFQILDTDDLWDGHIYSVQPQGPLEIDEVSTYCEGMTVVDVATSDYWPSVGVVLSNGLLIHLDAPATYEYLLVASVLGDRYPRDKIHRVSYQEEDIRSIWEAPEGRP
jgi:hypothetical protein